MCFHDLLDYWFERGDRNRVIVAEHLGHIAPRIRDFWDLQYAE
jgi:hypothetical protein